eukprot:403361206
MDGFTNTNQAQNHTTKSKFIVNQSKDSFSRGIQLYKQGQQKSHDEMKVQDDSFPYLENEGESENNIVPSESVSQLMKPLIFGLSEDLQYTHHKNQVKQFLINKNNQLFITADDKQIHFWSMQNGMKKKVIHLPEYLKAHSAVSTLAYSQKYRLYLLVTADFKMIFINEVYNIVKAQEMNSIRLVNFAHFYDQKNKLITAGIDGVFIFDFSYQGKYEPFQASQIDPEGKTIKIEIKNKITLEGMPIWAKGMKVDEQNDMIICWDHLNLTFHELSSGQHKLLNSYKSLLIDQTQQKISDANQNITDILICKEYRYFITSTTLGHLLVWKHSKNKKLIHKYQGHFREIGSLSKHPSGDESMFLSFSIDGSVKIWSLDKFNMLYQFTLPYKLTMCKLFNNGTKIFAAQQNKIMLSDLHLNADTFMLPPEVEIRYIVSSFQQNYSFYNETSNVMTNGRQSMQLSKQIVEHGLVAQKKLSSKFHQDFENQNYQPFQLILCEDNSVFIQDTLTQKLMSTLYPPPTAQQTVALFHSRKLNRLLVLLITGSICIYQFNKETSLLEKILKPSQFRDSEGKSVGTQKIMCTQLIRCENKSQWIKPIDQDIFNEKIHLNAIQNFIKDNEDVQEYLAFGMSKGQLYIVNTQKMEQIYARLTISRASVKLIHYIPEKQLFISMCDDLIIKVWTIDAAEKKINQVKIYRQETDKTKEHDSSLTGLDYHPLLQLLVTSCTEGLIKIWKMPKKILVKEIKFPGKIDSVCFRNKNVIYQSATQDLGEKSSNKYDESQNSKNLEGIQESMNEIQCGDLLVAHEKRVSIVKYETYFTEEDIKRVADLEEKDLSKSEITEQMFYQMMVKENEIRGVQPIINQQHQQQNTKVQDESPSPQRQQLGQTKNLFNSSLYDAMSRIEQEKPKSPMTLKAEQLFDRIDKMKQLNQEKKKINPLKLDYLKSLQEREIEPEVKIDVKPSIHAYLGQKSRSIVINLASSFSQTYKQRKQTRRDITSQRISDNIMKFNSPTTSKDFKTLRLGPLPFVPQHARYQSTHYRTGDYLNDALNQEYSQLFNLSKLNLHQAQQQTQTQTQQTQDMESLQNIELMQSQTQDKILFQNNALNPSLLESPSYILKKSKLSLEGAIQAGYSLFDNKNKGTKTRTQKHTLINSTLNNSPINYKSIYKLDETSIGINLQNAGQNQRNIKNQKNKHMQSFMFPSTQETSIVEQSLQENSLLDNSQSLMQSTRQDQNDSKIPQNGHVSVLTTSRTREFNNSSVIKDQRANQKPIIDRGIADKTLYLKNPIYQDMNLKLNQLSPSPMNISTFQNQTGLLTGKRVNQKGGSNPFKYKNHSQANVNIEIEKDDDDHSIFNSKYQQQQDYRNILAHKQILQQNSHSQERVYIKKPRNKSYNKGTRSFVQSHQIDSQSPRVI